MGANGTLSGAEIFARLQTAFGDDNAIQLTEAKVIRWINDGMREAVMQHEGLLQKESTINVVADQARYSLPADLFTLSRVYLRETTSGGGGTYYALRRMSQKELDLYVDGWQGEVYGSSTPVAYTVIDNELILFPTPGTAWTDGVKLDYARYPVDLTILDSAIDLPAYYHSYIEHFCMMKCYEMDEDWESHDRKAGLLQSTLNFNNNREGWFGRETYPSITIRPEDY